MQEPVEVTLEGNDKVYCIPLEDMLQKLLNDELVLEEVYMSLYFCTGIKWNYNNKKLPCKLSWCVQVQFCVYGQWQRYIEPRLVVTVQWCSWWLLRVLNVEHQSHGCRLHVDWLAYFYILPFDWVLLSFTIFCGDESDKTYNCLCYNLTITCCYRNNGNMYSEYLCISQRLG